MADEQPDLDQSNCGSFRYTSPKGHKDGGNVQHIMPRQQFQSVRKAADCLEVTEATVRRWIKRGDPQAIGPGKSWRIATSDLEEFLPGHQTLKRQSAGQGGHSDKANTV